MSGASYLIFIQVVSRGLTFAGNQLLLRFIAPETLGIATQLELYSVSVLYFSRESLRVALQRRPLQNEALNAKGKDQAGTQKQAQASINVSYIPIFLGLALSLLLGASFWQFGSEIVVRSPQFLLCLQLYGLAAFIELLGEPGFTLVQLSLDFRARAKIETLAAIMKCLTACFMALFTKSNGMSVGILPFAAGQLVYSFFLFLGNIVSGFQKAKACGVSLLPQSIASKDDYYWWDRFSQKLISLSITLYMQSAVKQVLTQGDTFILATFAKLEDQGAFALASNYGGLAARLVFQPIEESSRNSFGQYASRSPTGDRNKDGLNHAIELLCSILKAYGIMSVLITCFAPSLFPVIVRVLVGNRWFSPAMRELLATYCLYIPFMAINGITEAFVSSVASTQELKSQSIWMGAFSAGFGLAAFVFLQVLEMGASGLVWANVVNMLLRTLWCLTFIKTHSQRQGNGIQLANTLPSPWSILSGLAASAYLRSSTTSIESFRDLLNPAIMCALGGLSILFFERNFLRPYILKLLR